MLSAIVFDASRSLSREWSRSFLAEFEKNCNKIRGFFNVIYARQGIPLSPRAMLLRDAIKILEEAPFLPGSSDPYAGVRELVEILKGKMINEIIIIWSMSKRPRLPFAFAFTLARSLGAQYIALITPRAYLPRWIDSYLGDIVDEETFELISRAGKQRARLLAEKLGCKI